MASLKLTLTVVLIWLVGASTFSPAAAQRMPKAEPGPLVFKIKLDRSAASAGAGGRMIVFMTDAASPPSLLTAGFVPGQNWIAAADIAHIAPGQVIILDPNKLAYPRPFSQAKPAHYSVMALLDQDRNYAYMNQDGDDLYSDVKRLGNIDPHHANAVTLVLTHRPKAAQLPAETSNIKLFTLISPSLTQFWHRPYQMRAVIVLPTSYLKGNRQLPTLYHIHGFSDTISNDWGYGAATLSETAAGMQPEMVHVFLDAVCPSGHSEFADSANNGPWGQALTKEFIPRIEKRYGLISRSDARFLTGHSSGGWSSLWLQVTYPDFFDGTWSTSPDPVDLRSFTGVDVTPGSHENMYVDVAGHVRNLIRGMDGDAGSIKSFVRQERVEGEYGGQFSSFEAVWSPKGSDGHPMPLFDRQTGVQSPIVQRAWRKYDISYQLRTNWADLGPKLRGKLHIIVGRDDTFHLESAVQLLAASLQQLHSDAVCEIVPGRDHMNLYAPNITYPNGLEVRIVNEAYAKFIADQMKG